MDLPGIGVIPGEWDLRKGMCAYLGHVSHAGKRVLEVGTADGFLAFEMERQGAEVVALDISENEDWDIVPCGGHPSNAVRLERRNHIRRINNAWWYSHRLLGSQAQMVYSSAYAIPETIGPVDIATFGSILLHLRDPFLALQRAAALTSEIMIVTEVVPRFWRTYSRLLALLPSGLRRKVSNHLVPHLTFVPDPVAQRPWDTWWRMSPDFVSRFLHVLGFPDSVVNYHDQQSRGRTVTLFTVVGRRSGPSPGTSVSAGKNGSRVRPAP